MTEFKFTNDWYGRRDELVEAIEEEGYEVLENNSEYISFVNPYDDEDIEYVAYLGGTPRTITIEKIIVV